MVPILLYQEAAPPLYRIDAYLVRDGESVPLKRVDELEPEPIIFPGAPTTGAEAAQAREIVDRFEDVRVAAAILAGAAAKAEDALDACLAVGFSRLSLDHAWATPARGAAQPLRRIAEACADFEAAIATPGERLVAEGEACPDVAAVEALTSLDARTKATIAAVEKTASIIASTQLPHLPHLPRLQNLPQIPTLVAEAPPAADAPPELSEAEAAVLLAQRPWPVADAPPALSPAERAEFERQSLGLRDRVP
jgi:hypothetical protein